MLITNDEVVTSPPDYRLFEHISLQVELRDVTEGVLTPNSHCVVWIALGTILNPAQIECTTNNFPVVRIPDYAQVWSIWERINHLPRAWSYGELLLRYFRHQLGLQLDFKMKHGKMLAVRVSLGADLASFARLPVGFDYLEYFGEVNKLKD